MARARDVDKARDKAKKKPAATPVAKAEPTARTRGKVTAARVRTTELPAAMTGRASPVDERQAAPWMQQATAIPGFGRKR